MEQVVPDNVPTGEIHQIPVVDASGVTQVELIDRFSLRFKCAFTLYPIDQDQQDTKPGLVPRTIQ